MATTTFPNSRPIPRTDAGVRPDRAGAKSRETTTVWHRVVATTASTPLLIARLSLGLVIFPHGLQKMFHVLGGGGFSGTMAMFEGQGIPAALAFLAIMAEFLGSMGLIVGCLSRIAAFGILCNMLVAIVMVHAPNGFFMNWMGTQHGEGFEYHLLAAGLALAVIVGGAGRYSVDRLLSLRGRREWRRSLGR